MLIDICRVVPTGKRNIMTMSGEPYRTGDFVWLYTPIKKVGVSPKLQKFWDGPYLVLDRLNDAVYRIQRSEKSIPRLCTWIGLKSIWDQK